MTDKTDPPESPGEADPPNPAPTPDPNPNDDPGAAGGAKGDDKGKGAKTPLTDPGDKEVDKGKWPETWQEDMAGGDEETLKLLKRYGSPQAVGEALAHQRAKISEKPTWPKPPEGATDKQLAAWREETGLPEKPDGYLEDLPDGLVIGDDDKPALEALAQKMHELHASPETVHAVIQTYYEVKEAEETERLEKDEAQKKEAEDALREEWGNASYRGNVNRVLALFEQLPGGVKDAILNARDAQTGDPLASNPGFLRGMLQVALDLNPAATVVDGTGTDQPQAIADEIAKYKTMMEDQNGEYWKGPKSEGHQKRYRELLTAQEKLEARQKTAA